MTEEKIDKLDFIKIKNFCVVLTLAAHILKTSVFQRTLSSQ